MHLAWGRCTAARVVCYISLMHMIAHAVYYCCMAVYYCCMPSRHALPTRLPLHAMSTRTTDRLRSPKSYPAGPKRLQPGTPRLRLRLRLRLRVVPAAAALVHCDCDRAVAGAEASDHAASTIMLARIIAKVWYGKGTGQRAMMMLERLKRHSRSLIPVRCVLLQPVLLVRGMVCFSKSRGLRSRNLPYYARMLGQTSSFLAPDVFASTKRRRRF